MHSHGPNCLTGPVSRKRRCWQGKTRRQGKPAAATEKQDRPIRFELVQRVRREIAAGRYDTPEKWAMALHRLLQSLEEA